MTYATHFLSVMELNTYKKIATFSKDYEKSVLEEQNRAGNGSGVDEPTTTEENCENPSEPIACSEKRSVAVAVTPEQTCFYPV